MNNCITICPCCGQFLQIDFSIINVQAYPFSGNPYNAINATHGAIYNQDKEEENDNG